MRHHILLLSGLLSASAPARAACGAWDGARPIGQLDPDVLGEASGLALSRAFPGRAYHVNDSGDVGRFFLSAWDGSAVRDVGIEGFSPKDAEDLALGPCGKGTCLFVADVGDNKSKRGKVTIAVVRERADFGAKVKPERLIKARYPDGPHNAESLAVDARGDIFVLTKESPGKLFRLAASAWAQAKDTLAFERVGTVRLPGDGEDALATSMDISPDGRSLAILTYGDAYVLPWGPNEADVAGTRDVARMIDAGQAQRVPLSPLPKQESLAFTPDGKGLVYTSESHEGAAEAVMAIPCLP